MVIFVTLASPTMVLEPQWSWKTWSLISQLLVQSEKQMIAPETLEDKCGSSDQQVLRCCDISSSCAGS